MIITYRIIIVLINSAIIFYIANRTTRKRDSLRDGLLIATITGLVFSFYTFSIFVFTGTGIGLVSYIVYSIISSIKKL